MRNLKKRFTPFTLIVTCAAAAACLCIYGAVLLVGSSTAAAQMRDDPRRKTTVQTATIDAGSAKNAVEVRYLNMPFGERTFGYIETGVDSNNRNYYASRDWPIAHLTLASTAVYDGKTLEPGDYVMIITPKNPAKNEGMMLSIASFKPATEGGTFLKPGDVFTEVPKDAVVISRKPVTFQKGAPLNQQLEIGLAKKASAVDINIHYGNRMLTEELIMK